MAKLGRPRLPDDQLKNPRVEYKHKSVYNGVQLNVPQPTDTELARWAGLVEKCRVAILTNASCHDGEKKNKVEVEIRGKAPEGFPTGRIVKTLDDGGTLRRFNAEALLMWLWERKLAPWNAGMLYKLRRDVWSTMHGNLSLPHAMWLEQDIEALI